MKKYFIWLDASFFKIAFLLIVSLFLWLYSKTSFAMFFYTPWIFIAQGLGVITVMLISVNFILATRVKPLRRAFMNLENLYRVHKNTGISAMVFAILHFVAFMIHSISFPSLFYFYLVPGDYWSLNYARAALFLYILLVVLSVIRSIPYHIWKWTHQFMVLALVFTFLHVWTINSDVSKDMFLRYWLLGWTSVALVSYGYIKLVYPLLGNRNLHVVKEIKELKGKVFQIKMAPLNKPLKYLPSQYIFVSFLCKELGKELHPFTLTSIQEDGTLEIAPKEIGDYTKKFHLLKAGTKVRVWGPYGSFSDEYLKDESEQVWISGGIGATPFLGMISHERLHKTQEKKWFFYCCRNEEEATFDKVFRKMTSGQNITLIEHYSDDQGYLTYDWIKEHVPDLKNKKFLICGPPPMKYKLIDCLLDEGIYLSNIVHEDFNLR